MLNTEARPMLITDQLPALNPTDVEAWQADFEEWDQRGLVLYEDHRMLKFQIIRWMKEGERFGEEMYQSEALAKFHAYSHNYVDQIMHVGRNVPEENWIPGATWSHLREVASIHEPAKQRKLLEQAVKNDLSVDELKVEVRKAKAVKGQAPEIQRAFNMHFRAQRPGESKRGYEAAMDQAYREKKAEHLAGEKDHVEKAKRISRRESKKKRR